MSIKVPVMPDSYKGELLTKTKYVNNTPRRWTKEEEEWCLKLEKEGFSQREIAESVGRGRTSVSIKMKRLKKKDGRYNAPHVEEKHSINNKFIEHIKPDSILDVYCGHNKVYDNKARTVINNDIDEEIDADYHLDALKLLCLMHYEGRSFDFIDLDPYGSASECFDLALKMAKKGIAITLGEMGHKRFKRLDYVNRHYGIHDLDDFTTDNLIKFIQGLALKQRKQLKIYEAREWNGISRVWFEVADIKITEQWD